MLKIMNIMTRIMIIITMIMIISCRGCESVPDQIGLHPIFKHNFIYSRFFYFFLVIIGGVPSPFDIHKCEIHCGVKFFSILVAVHCAEPRCVGAVLTAKKQAWSHPVEKLTVGTIASINLITLTNNGIREFLTDVTDCHR